MIALSWQQFKVAGCSCYERLCRYEIQLCLRFFGRVRWKSPSDGKKLVPSPDAPVADDRESYIQGEHMLAPPPFHIPIDVTAVKLVRR